MPRTDIPRLFRFLWPHLRQERRKIILALWFMGIGVALQLPLPLVTRYIIDDVLPRRDLKGLTFVVFGLVAFLLAKGAADVLYTWIHTAARERALLSIQTSLLKHVHAQGMAFFASGRSSDVVARINNDVANLGSFLGTSLFGLLRDATTFLVGLGAILWFHPGLALASIAILPLFIVATRAFSSRARRASEDYQKTFADVWEALQEPLGMMAVVKAFQTEAREQRKFNKAARSRIDVLQRMTLVSSLSAATVAVVGGLGPLVVLWYGGHEVIAGRLTVGTLLAFSVFVGYLFGPAQRLGNLNSDLQRSLASFDRLGMLLGLVPSISDPDRPLVPLHVGQGTVEFRDVWFGYEADRPVLRGVTFAVLPGSTVAVVGSSGAGKTTIVSLIERFYSTDRGVVLVNGVNVAERSQADLRRGIGVVFQDPQLVSGTIRDNISYGSPDSSDEEVRAAAVLANAWEFIEALPLRLDTDIGEKGVRLSGGQRQRLAIARALLRNPGILILDEATSEVDAESEQLIRSAIERARRGRTTLIIAHRFATVVRSDWILVLDEGRVAAAGRHGDLYRQCRLYRELCDCQFITDGLDIGEDANVERFRLGVR